VTLVVTITEVSGHGRAALKAATEEGCLKCKLSRSQVALALKLLANFELATWQHLGPSRVGQTLSRATA